MVRAASFCLNLDFLSGYKPDHKNLSQEGGRDLSVMSNDCAKPMKNQAILMNNTKYNSRVIKIASFLAVTVLNVKGKKKEF